ncbi:hypothetical protein [Parendozoicomonas haliclonae]|uniref:hypothetical protein n=1 Tax=Parendozoicomonas haliclonae TaxID=1960125 RepID=UPI00105659DF|nr:hypothetical protein [Parendozoicomonas haliclonae]
MNSTPLYRRNILARKACLDKEKISAEAYQKEQARASKLPLQQDDFLLSLNEPHLSARAEELDDLFQRVGPEGFACKELGTVLANAVVLLKDWLDQEDCYATEELQALITLLEGYLLSTENYDYRRVHALVMQFLNICEEYEAGLGHSVKQRCQKKRIAALIETDFMEVYAGRDAFRSKLKALGVYDPLTYDMSHPMDSLFLFWPSFQALPLTFFTRSLRYNIKPIGILAARWAFHDGRLFPRSLFYRHDRFHARQQSQGHITDRDSKQTLLEAREHAVGTITQDKDIQLAIWLLLFTEHHEAALDLLSRGQYAASLETLADMIEEHDQLTKTITPLHLEAGKVILDYVEPRLPMRRSRPKRSY